MLGLDIIITKIKGCIYFSLDYKNIIKSQKNIKFATNTFYLGCLQELLFSVLSFKTKKYLSSDLLSLLIRSYISSQFGYCNALCFELPNILIDKLQRI